MCVQEACTQRAVSKDCRRRLARAASRTGGGRLAKAPASNAGRVASFLVRRITWFVAAVVPALCAIAVTPALVYLVAPPEIKSTPEAPAAARARLVEMGPLSRDERCMLGTMAVAARIPLCKRSPGSPLLDSPRPLRWAARPLQAALSLKPRGRPCPSPPALLRRSELLKPQVW